MGLVHHPAALLLICLCFVPSVSVKRSKRQIWSWTSWKVADETIAQLYNSSWTDLIDGIQVWCGCSFTSEGLALDEETWSTKCVPIIEAAKETNTEFHLMISGGVPESTDPTQHIVDGLKIQELTGIDGFSLDDESNCAPRATTSNFTKWMNWVDLFVDGLHEEGIPVSDAIQAVFAIEDGKTNNACSKEPSAYPFPKRVVDRMSESSIDKWLIMDTYYFSTGRFLGALDWHAHYLPLDRLGVGIQNRSKWTEDELVARFHAIHRSRIDWINVFEMPVDDAFLPYLKRWKAFCQGCGEQPVLGCFDMQIECEATDGKHKAAKSQTNSQRAR